MIIAADGLTESGVATTDRLEQQLSAVVVSPSPYPYAVVQHVLDEALAAAVLDWLERDAEWEIQEASFYVQHRCSNLDELAGSDARGVTDPYVLGTIVQYLERWFGVPIDPHNVTLAAHMLLPGQGIGIHTDEPRFGTETHRLVLHLTRAFDDRNGGHLVLFRERDPTTIEAVIRPAHNVAVAFPLSDRSFHAVTDITAGVRYSLVFGFWARGSTPSELMVPVVPDGAELQFEGADDLLAALDGLGARAVPHSSRTLYDHLVGTALIAERWGAEPHVRRAALFHSAYGTSGFNAALLDGGRRTTLQALLGAEAEDLVYLFCVVDRAHPMEADPTGVVTATHRTTGEPIVLHHHTVIELRLLLLANVLEQAPYMQLTAEEQLEVREEVLAIAEHLPDIAGDDLARAFGALG